jgi:serine/threonine protein phosphatase PrpC
MNRWRVTGKSWRGAAHIESGLQNQDAIRYFSSEGDTFVILAVADGHGSALSFRSDIGSRFAAETAVESLRAFAETIDYHEDESFISRRVPESLPSRLVECWRAAVHRELEANPFTPAELASVAANAGWSGQEALQRHPELAYGTTLVAVLATERWILYLQLGDGDVLFVDSHDAVHRPIASIHRGRKEQINSLWQPNAASNMRVNVERTSDAPSLIVVSTDGFSKSYTSDEKFLDAGRELKSVITQHGLDGIEQRIAAVMDENPDPMSGDDITIGLICNLSNPLPLHAKDAAAGERTVTSGKWAVSLKYVLGLTR